LSARLNHHAPRCLACYADSHDNGGVYFNVLATGVPYLEGTERLKGSHSMSGYHSFELCYLASVYTNLLITRQPMDFYFKPQPGAWKNDILHVAPDLLPPGSVRIESMTINGSPWTDFDSEAMTVKLPQLGTEAHPLEKRPGWAGNPQLASIATRELKVKVRIVPATLLFDAFLNLVDGGAELTLVGELSDAAEPVFRAELDRLIPAKPKRVVIRVENLRMMSNRSARALDFIAGKLALDNDIYVVGANESVKKTLQDIGVWESFTTVDSYADVTAQKT